MAQVSLGETRHKISRLLAVYISALVIMLGSVMLSAVLTELEARSIKQDAARINLAGIQRTLSQRIIYLVTARRDAPSALERRDLGDDLRKAIERFEAAAETLAQERFLPDAVDGQRATLRLPHANGANGVSIHLQMRAYIEFARKLLEDPDDASSIAALKEIERGGILDALDQEIRAFEETSRERFGELRRLELVSLGIAATLLLAEVLLVFRPGHRLLKANFLALESHNTALLQAQMSLREKNADLEAKNEIIAASHEELQYAWRQSEELRKEQADFTYSVSHGLKTPANSIDLLLRELLTVHGASLDADAQELLGHARSTIDQLHELIEEILQYSRVTENHEPPARLDMAVCLDRALATLETQLEKADAVITKGKLDDIDGYASQIPVLFATLISNAIKYQPKAQRPHVEVSCVASASGAVLRVKDNGIGIAPEDQVRVFDLFTRLHARDTFSGSGLGLTTSRRIAENHDGHISVVSALGQGSTFEVILNAPTSDRRSPDTGSGYNKAQPDPARPEVKENDRDAA